VNFQDEITRFIRFAFSTIGNASQLLNPTKSGNPTMIKKISLAAILAACSLLHGCATLTSGTTQSVTVETFQGETAAPGFECKVTNPKGSWVVTTPGSFTINKAAGDAQIVCSKAGQSAEAFARSATKAHTVGNILVGGVIGIGVDMMSGATWAYPPMWKVMLGVMPQLIKGDGTQGSPEESAEAKKKFEEEAVKK
jgi:hypothetical protein